jgi:hypothetical protein
MRVLGSILSAAASRALSGTGMSNKRFRYVSMQTDPCCSNEAWRRAPLTEENIA